MAFEVAVNQGYGALPQPAAMTLGAAPTTQGNLPFPGGAGSIPFGGNAAQLAQSYAQSYNAALAMNQTNYNNILQGYQQAVQRQRQEQQAVQQQYGALDRRIMGELNLAGSTRRQEIQDQYAQLAGAQSQQLIDRGLGNSTIQASVNRGLAFDESKSQNQLAEQIANLRAQYGTNIGMAGIGYAGQAVRDATGLTQAQLDWMNSVQSPYPDAGLYASLAMQYEQAKAAERAAGSGYGFNPAGGMGGGVTYGPKDPAFGRPSAGLFGASGSFGSPAPSGMGYNPALYAPAVPAGYGGGAGYYDPKAATSYSGATPAVGMGGDALAAVTGYAALQGGGGYVPQDVWAPTPGVDYSKQEAVY